MPRNIVRRKRLFQPANSERLIGAGAADRFVHRKGLVGIGENLKARPDCLAHRRDAADILVDGTPHLELAAAEAVGLGPQRIVHEGRLLEMQPAALCGVERYLPLCPARQLVQRQAELCGN